MLAKQVFVPPKFRTKWLLFHVRDTYGLSFQPLDWKQKKPHPPSTQFERKPHQSWEREKAYPFHVSLWGDT